jgi:hypothetical protein
MSTTIKTLTTIALTLCVCQAHLCPTEIASFSTKATSLLTYVDTPTKVAGRSTPPVSKAGDVPGISHIIDLCVERAGPRWSPAAKASAATQYLALFQRGDASALTGAVVDVWGEHVLFTKQYQSHLNAAGHRWHEMTPAKYQHNKVRSSTTPHSITVAGKSFALRGMAEVQAKQGWTDAQLAKAVAAYGQFVRAILANKQLPKAERGGLAPSHAVDEVWHQHMRFQAAYRQMSAALLGGRRRFLHHAPHISDADSASGPSSYAHTLKLIGDAGETPDAWAWPRTTMGDGCCFPGSRCTVTIACATIEEDCGSTSCTACTGPCGPLTGCNPNVSCQLNPADGPAQCTTHCNVNNCEPGCNQGCGNQCSSGQ